MKTTLRKLAEAIDHKALRTLMRVAEPDKHVRVAGIAAESMNHILAAVAKNPRIKPRDEEYIRETSEFWTEVESHFMRQIPSCTERKQ